MTGDNLESGFNDVERIFPWKLDPSQPPHSTQHNTHTTGQIFAHCEQTYTQTIHRQTDGPTDNAWSSFYTCVLYNSTQSSTSHVRTVLAPKVARFTVNCETFSDQNSGQILLRIDLMIELV